MVWPTLGWRTAKEQEQYIISLPVCKLRLFSVAYLTVAVEKID